MTVENMLRRPNFFLIGAAKCGTTSAASYLDQHPDVFVSKPKEPNFFAFEPGSTPTCRGPVDSEQLNDLLLKYSLTSLKEYNDLFAPAQQQKAVGEASVRYLYETKAAERINSFAPAAKLIAILRDPVDRAYSHYHMNVRQHIEPETFESALDLEDDRVEDDWGWDWHYRRVGMYGEQVERYFANFDRAQLHVVFHTDLQDSPLQAMQRVFRHLEVSSEFEPDFSQRAMVGHTPRWRLLRRIVRDDNPVKSAAKQIVPRRMRKSFVEWSETKNRQAIPRLHPKLRQKLRQDFAKDSQRLADLLGRKLPW